jgi:hypothetical protein
LLLGEHAAASGGKAAGGGPGIAGGGRARGGGSIDYSGSQGGGDHHEDDDDTATLSFLRYHDAVVDAFTAAVQPHIQAVIRRRSQLAAGSGFGIWSSSGGSGGRE